ncbi:hypothetical protein HALA3H3_720028 [Halomonas sp. A3H3]|nr:conserved hypothetical protein [Halomonas sp. 156]CAD5257179.1 conserved hypothetical protein [Halomonas sp. I3]CDG54328.1 hypothetical protein HALA3H3_720028 [Halomonas sp. A3H3]VXC01565.1 conserved hypothetical protein [Halomonas titanicae]VXC76128.1 conserved hypothetical protein [Halomonas titanicae]
MSLFPKVRNVAVRYSFESGQL